MPQPPTTPFVHDRRLVMGDTDAAGIVYTGRFPQFCLEALESWWIERVDTDWFSMIQDTGFATPFVNLTIDLMRPLTPRDGLAITVGLKKIGRTSLHFAIDGHALPSRELSFKAGFVCVYTEMATMRPAPLPAHYLDIFTREHALYRRHMAGAALETA